MTATRTAFSLGEFLDQPVRLSTSLRERKGYGGIRPDTYQILPPSSNHINILETLQRRGITAEGRIFHLDGPMEGGWRVLDVWESQEAANKFFQEALGPTFQELGFALAQPRQVWPVHICLIGPEHHL